jgi:hypothetical protein
VEEKQQKIVSVKLKFDNKADSVKDVVVSVKTKHQKAVLQDIFIHLDRCFNIYF